MMSDVTKAMVEAQIAELEVSLKSLAGNDAFFARIEKGFVRGKINELKRYPVFWPEICHKLYAWRGERSLREVLPLFAERDDVGINTLARIENGYVDYDAELLQFIESVISAE